MTASHYSLNNVIAIVDRNYFQLTGGTEETLRKEPLADKWRVFGWTVIEVPNERSTIETTLDYAERINGRPKVIIASGRSDRELP